MAMNIDDFCELIRSGQVNIWIVLHPNPAVFTWCVEHPEFEMQIDARLSAYSATIAPAVIEQVQNEYSWELYALLFSSNTLVCGAPEQHWKQYYQAEGEDWYRCDLCEEARKPFCEGISEQPVPATILEFKKREES